MTMTLTIVRLTNEFAGDYFCHAENERGSDTKIVSVRIRNTAPAHNVSECCVAQNVSSACMDACSFYIDIDAVKSRPECLVDFDKLMRCAADGELIRVNARLFATKTFIAHQSKIPNIFRLRSSFVLCQPRCTAILLELVSRRSTKFAKNGFVCASVHGNHYRLFPVEPRSVAQSAD